MLMMSSHRSLYIRLFFVVLFVMSVVGVVLWLMNPSYQTALFETTHRVRLGDVVFYVALADDESERITGLSNVEQLGEKQGMLFIFDKPGIYTFWMKDMRFDLDFLWIVDGVVREITEGVSSAPQHQYRLLRPSIPVNQVLELPAGSVTRWGIRVGDELVREE